MTTKKYNEFIGENNTIDEGKAASILASLGKHAVAAIVAYLAQNPEVIGNVIDNLKGSNDSKVRKEMSNL